MATTTYLRMVQTDSRAVKTSTQISATGRSTSKPRSRSLRCAGQTGFTLLEILVVLLIIGILTTVAVLSSGIVSDDRELEQSGQRLRSLIDLARDESVLQNREYGIALTIEGYEFVMFDNFTGQWLLFPPDDLFRPRNLPEEIEFGLTVEDRDILLPRNRVDPEIEPHIIFYASGEQTPFEIRIARRNQDDTYVITGDLTGKIEDQQPNEES